MFLCSSLPSIDITGLCYHVWLENDVPNPIFSDCASVWFGFFFFLKRRQDLHVSQFVLPLLPRPKQTSFLTEPAMWVTGTSICPHVHFCAPHLSILWVLDAPALDIPWRTTWFSHRNFGWDVAGLAKKMAADFPSQKEGAVATVIFWGFQGVPIVTVKKARWSGYTRRNTAEHARQGYPLSTSRWMHLVLVL